MKAETLTKIILGCILGFPVCLISLAIYRTQFSGSQSGPDAGKIELKQSFKTCRLDPLTVTKIEFDGRHYVVFEDAHGICALRDEPTSLLAAQPAEKSEK